MTANHWESALQELEKNGNGLFGPKSFRDYLEDIEEDPRDYRTAAEISIDTLRQLSSELRERETMVFRLGYAPNGAGTAFALVQLEDRLEDFFVQEHQYPVSERVRLDFSQNGQDVDLLTPQARDMLDAYRLLPNFSESSYVNLALSTGLLGRSLNLDADTIGTAPTTIASSFSFEFRPHSRLSHELYHNNGQVEVDAIIITRKHGKRTMLVIEAKTGKARTLAKHKLFYPYLAVKNLASEDIDEIIPIYMRANAEDDKLAYDIYEGAVNSAEGQQPAIDELTIADDYHFSIQI